MLEIVLPIWAWAIVLVIGGIAWVVGKISQSTEHQRVAQRHRSLPSSMAPRVAPRDDHGPPTSDAGPTVQDW